MKAKLLFAAAMLLPLCVHANPLRELQSGLGGAMVDYERATGADREFERLAAAPAPVYRVAVAGDDPQEAARIAAAWVEGLLAVVPGAVEAGSSAEAAEPDYLIELRLTRGSRQVEASEEVYGIRSTGTSCASTPEGLVCTGGTSAPIAVGTRTTEKEQKRLAAVLRFYRLGEGGERAVVFEDAFSLEYAGEDCRKDIAAAETVALALGRNALSRTPLNIRTPSTPKLLGCDRK